MNNDKCPLCDTVNKVSNTTCPGCKNQIRYNKSKGVFFTAQFSGNKIPNKKNEVFFFVYWYSNYAPGFPYTGVYDIRRAQAFFCNPTEHGFDFPNVKE